VVHEDTPLDRADPGMFTIAAHEAHSLVFCDEDHFDWGLRLPEDIYLRLYLIGDGKPIWLWITGPAQ
jgi:hypothetical protein